MEWVAWNSVFSLHIVSVGQIYADLFDSYVTQWLWKIIITQLFDSAFNLNDCEKS